MKGQCNRYQVPQVPEVGLAANNVMGGDDKTAVCQSSVIVNDDGHNQHSHIKSLSFGIAGLK